MDSKYCLLDLPVSQGKDMGKGRRIYSFKKDEHAKLLLNNLAEMQANEGLLTDMVACTTSEDYKEPFHSILLAACSPVIRQSLTGKHFDCTDGILCLKDCTAEVLEAFRDFLYKTEFPSDEELVDPLKAFAKRYDINSLEKLCREDKDQRSSDQEMSSRHRDGVLSQLYEMFQRKELATTLLEDGEGNTQFAVHGPLVAAASPVLRKMLSNDLFSRKGAKYRLKEVPSNILRDLIEYIYTGEVTLEDENVEGLFDAAFDYEVPALVMACCDWLALHLDSHNAVGILWLARKTNSKYTKVLEEEAKTFIITNFPNVCEEAEFDELEYEDLKEILQHDDLRVKSEEDVFYAAAKWVEADEDGRSPYMEVLLQCVRLNHTSLEFLRKLQEDPRIVKSESCLQIVRDAQGKLVQEPTERSSFDSHEQSLFQSGDTPGLKLQHFDNEELLQTPRLPELEEVSPRRGKRKDGTPDMRYKGNRQPLGLKKKDGSPDMRFKINKEKHGKLPSQGNVTAPKSQKEVVDDRPLKKDGTPDRRFKVNKGPVKKDGTPDMRFAENKTPNGGKSSPVTKTPSSGSAATPVKRDGTPDMRFAVNKQSSSLVTSSETSSPGPQSSYTRGPVKKDGTPDMRYAVNKQSASPSPSSSYGGSSQSQLSSYSSPSGPVKRDGTPDMRYAENKSSYGSPLSSGYSSGGSSYSARSSSSGSVFGSSSCGPLKRDGTPDMRYAVNRSSSGSPLSSGYSSGATSYSSRSSSSGGAFGSSSGGPLKSNGTPDMRYKANWR